MKILLLFSLLAASVFAADVIPDSKLAPARMRVVNGPYGIGVIGGIPGQPGGPADYSTVVDLTQPPYNFVPGGNLTTPLQTAFNNLPNWGATPTVILIPPGAHTMGQVSIHFFKYNVIVRGAGSGATTITGGSITMGNSPRSSLDPNVKVSNITAGLTKDSTSVTVVDGTEFLVGHIATIEIPNDWRKPVLQPNAIAQYIRRYNVFVTAKAGNVITFNPPLVDDWSDVAAFTGTPVRLASDVEHYPQSGMGVEGITFQNTPQVIIGMSSCRNSWIRDVKWSGQGNHGVQLNSCINFEMRRSWAGATGDVTFHSNQSGILPESCTSLLIEDNNFELNFPNIELWVGNNNVVIANNYFPISGYGNAMNMHNAHNSFVIFEGNIGTYVQAESYFGSQSETVAFRNWFNSYDGTNFGTPVGGPYDPFPPGGQIFAATDIQRFNRNSAMVGNLLRAPGIGTLPDNGHYYGWPYAGYYSNGTASLSTGDPWEDWDTVNNRPKQWVLEVISITSSTAFVVRANTTPVANDLESSLLHADASGGGRGRSMSWEPGAGTMGTRMGGNTWTISVNTGNPSPTVGSFITVMPGVSGFRERDMDTVSTMVVKNNYNYYDNAIPPGEALGSDTMSTSMFRTATPAYFGSIPWPAITPTAPPSTFNQATVENMLPAAWRYHKGNVDYEGGTSIPQFSPMPGAHTLPVAVTITCATPGASVFVSTDGSTPNTPYTVPINVTVSGTVIKTRATKSGLTDSAVNSGTYTESVEPPIEPGGAVAHYKVPGSLAARRK